MKTYNCKNCGAAVTHTYNHKCEYCGSMIDFNEPKDEVVEFKASDLIDIELKDISIEPITNNVKFIFSGFICPRPKIYEYDGKETFVSNTYNYVNPKKGYISIQIPRYEIEKYGINRIIHELYSFDLRMNEIEKLTHQIVDKIWRFGFNA